MNKPNYIEKIEAIINRNGLFGRYDDTEEGSFSEGEKILALLEEQAAGLFKEFEEMIGKDTRCGPDECMNDLRAEQREQLKGMRGE